MIKKDIALIKKIVSRANDNSIIKCVTCYVDTKTDDIICELIIIPIPNARYNIPNFLLFQIK